MDKTPRRLPLDSLYRLAIALGGLFFLVFTSLFYANERWEGLILAVFVPFLVLAPVVLFPVEQTLLNVIVLGGGILFGPTVVAWALLGGVLLGYFVRWLAWRLSDRELLPPPQRYLDVGFTFGIQTIPLVLGLYLTSWMEGYDGLGQLWPNVILPLVAFAFIQTSLYWGLIWLRVKTRAVRRHAVMELVMVQFIPLLFLGIAPMTYYATPPGVLVMLGGVPTALAALFYSMNLTRLKLERRLQELSMLENISHAMSATLNLEDLLTVIHQQVTQLLGVDNFYVALYDIKKNSLTYPLAVKFGERCHWPPRPLEPERLTDRVIREGKPILFTPQNQAVIEQAGLPTSVEDTKSWVGVPLITSERTIGCLAVFSIAADVQFTRNDQELLGILSGQVSAAIENAILYQQTQRRASQLEALNRIMALITASLDTQEVLTQVCKAVMELAEGQHSAVYLLHDDRQRCRLAYAANLSDGFVMANNASTVTQDVHFRCAANSEPIVIADLSQVDLPLEYLGLMQAEGISALADFPLATPDGETGILSIYYDHPHEFTPEEIELIQTLAYQAALAVSNARLYAIADKALARRADQLAILENVGRELAAAINSPRLFDMILDYALQFTNSSWGGLGLYDPVRELVEIKASRGYPQIDDRYPLGESISNQAIHSRQAVYVADTQSNPGYIDLTEGAARSQLTIPIIHEERVLGVLTLESDQVDAYSENDQAFIGQLATQAAVSVINANLYSETQRRLREQSMLYQIGSRLVANPELESVMNTVVQAFESSFPGAVAGAYLWDGAEMAYQLQAFAERHLPARLSEQSLAPIRIALFGTTSVWIKDDQPGFESLFTDLPHHQAILFPINVQRQRLGLAIAYLTDEQNLEEADLQLWQAIIAQISISWQNALLFQRVIQGRDQLEAVLNSVNDGLIMLDRSGHILLANQAVRNLLRMETSQLLDLSVAHLSGIALQSLGFTPLEVEDLAQRIQQGQVLTANKAIYRIIEKPERVIERLILPVWAQVGHSIGWIMVLRDITQETQALQARELITETLVHDLRSPVSAILSAVDILDHALELDKKSDELISQALRVAFNSANRVLGLIESLLDIAKLNAGRMELYLVDVNIADLIVSALTELLPQANELGVILRHDLPANLPSAHVDQSKITRVLTNLLDNALKFTPAGGQVSVSANLSEDARQLLVHVQDTGPGIPEEYREKIFERFTQVPGQKGRRRGSGLGLTFCRLAVEAHGGQIWVETQPNKGSRFTFGLPLQAELAADAAVTADSVEMDL